MHSRAVDPLFLLLVESCSRNLAKPSIRGGGGLPIIVIVVDTLGADHLSVYGDERPTSPCLEDWATKAVVFESGFSTSSWTLPSFGLLLTGQLASRHGADPRLAGHTGLVKAGLGPKAPTLPELLGSRNYRTAAVVPNPFFDRNYGVAPSFEENSDTWFMLRCKNAHRYAPRHPVRIP